MISHVSFFIVFSLVFIFQHEIIEYKFSEIKYIDKHLLFSRSVSKFNKQDWKFPKWTNIPKISKFLKNYIILHFCF